MVSLFTLSTKDFKAKGKTGESDALLSKFSTMELSWSTTYESLGTGGSNKVQCTCPFHRRGEESLGNCAKCH